MGQLKGRKMAGMKRLAVFLMLFGAAIAALDHNAGQELIASKKFAEAAEYYDKLILTPEFETEDPQSRALIKYYQALALYKLKEYEQAQIICEDILKISPRKIGFNVLMGLIYIQTGNERKGMHYLKNASLNEGIRLSNGVSIDRDKVAIRKRVLDMIANVDRLDPSREIDYEYYHRKLLEHYAKIRKYDSLGMEYEKLILKFPDDKKLYEELTEIYRKIRYNESLSLLLSIYLLKFGREDAVALKEVQSKYLILNAETDFNLGRIIDAKTNLDRISKDDIRKLDEMDYLKYYTLSLRVYYLLDIKEKVLELLKRITERKIKKIPAENLILFSQYALETDLPTAYRFINELLRVHPDEFMGYLLMAKYYTARKDESYPVELLGEIKKLPPSKYQAHFEYSKFLYEVSLEKYYTKEEMATGLDEAVDEIMMAVENMEKNCLNAADIYLTAGKIYFLKGLTLGDISSELTLADLRRRDYLMKNAAEYFRTFLKFQKENIEALEFLGWSYLYMREFANSFKAFSDILKIDPFSNEAKLQLKYLKSLVRSE